MLLLTLRQKTFFFLTNLKLQKFVYFAHGWYSAFTDKTLIADEVQSWQYGPVIQNLYNALRHYGAKPIIKKIQSDKSIDPASEDFAFIRSVYRKYAMLSPCNLLL